MVPIAYSRMSNSSQLEDDVYIGCLTNFCDLAVFMTLLKSDKSFFLKAINWMVTYIQNYYASSINYLKLHIISPLMSKRLHQLESDLYQIKNVIAVPTKIKPKKETTLFQSAKKIIEIKRKTKLMLSSVVKSHQQKCHLHRLTEKFYIIENKKNLKKILNMEFDSQNNHCQLKFTTNILNNQGIIKSFYLSKITQTITKFHLQFEIIEKIVPLLVICFQIIPVEFSMDIIKLQTKNTYHSFKNINQEFDNKEETICNII